MYFITRIKRHCLRDGALPLRDALWLLMQTHACFITFKWGGPFIRVLEVLQVFVRGRLEWVVEHRLEITFVYPNFREPKYVYISL